MVVIHFGVSWSTWPCHVAEQTLSSLNFVLAKNTLICSLPTHVLLQQSEKKRGMVLRKAGFRTTQ